MNHNQDTGKKGEDLAAQYLLERSYTILERNWRFKYWEVDIIASKKNKLHLKLFLLILAILTVKINT